MSPVVTLQRSQSARTARRQYEPLMTNMRTPPDEFPGTSGIIP
jgi:hypothetical protein